MRGFTLLEMIVVLTLLALIAGVSAIAVASLRLPAEAIVEREYRDARALAIKTGMPNSTRHVLFLPDGRAVGPGIDPLSGLPRAK